MQRHQEEARKSWKGASLGEEGPILEELAERLGPTPFLGYVYDREDPDPQHPERKPQPEIGTDLVSIIRAGKSVDSASAEAGEGTRLTLVLEETNLYAESGGQVGDRGEIVVESKEGTSARFVVEDTQKTPDEMIYHRGRLVSGELHVGDTVTVQASDIHSIKMMIGITEEFSSAFSGSVRGDRLYIKVFFRKRDSLVFPID